MEHSADQQQGSQNTAIVQSSTTETSSDAHSRSQSNTLPCSVTEDTIEASFKESEPHLQKLTRRIKKSFTEGAPCGYKATGDDLTPIASNDEDTKNMSMNRRSIMDNILSEVQQVFTEIQAEEKLVSPMNVKMAAKSYDSSIEDDVGSSSPHGDSTDTTLKQLALAKVGTNRGCISLDKVPLAEPEEFDEESDNGKRRDKDVQIMVETVEVNDHDVDDDEVFQDDPTHLSPKHHVRNSRSEGASTSSCDSSTSQQDRSRGKDTRINMNRLVDVNGNGTTKSQMWLERTFLELENIEPTISAENIPLEDYDFDMLEFAEKYYNVHLTASSYGNALSKTVKIVRRRSLTEIVPVADLLRYTKTSSMTTSLIHLHDPENLTIACSIFKDICKYMKSELKPDLANLAVRGIVAYGIDRVELRDEIYCQLVRQTNCNPNLEACIRGWCIFSLCAVSFSPSKTLNKYLLSYIKRNCDVPDPKIASYAKWCLQHLSVPKINQRCMPPSVAEIEAVRNLLPMVCKFYFFDGKIKAMGVDPSDTAADMLKKVQEKIDLRSNHGWALYEVNDKPVNIRMLPRGYVHGLIMSTTDADRYIRGYEYLADIISRWEEKQKAQHALGTPKKGSPKVLPPAPNYGKFVLCKRVFTPMNEVPNDPVEFHLLYAQALHYVVELDEYSIPEIAAVQLAGIQAQVLHGDYDEEKHYRYEDIDEYLCQRVIVGSHCSWSEILAASHKKYGTGKSELEAKCKYLYLVSQFPLYGSVKFFCNYMGSWTYGMETIIAVSFHGIKFISIMEKSIVYEYSYSDLSRIELDFEDHYIVIELHNIMPNRQKSYMFECQDIDQFAVMLEAYAPQISNWAQQTGKAKLIKWKPYGMDWLRLHDDVIVVRQALVREGVVKKPALEGVGLFKSVVKRISGKSSEKPEKSNIEETDDDYRGSFWSFSKGPIKKSIVAFESHELVDVSVRMFNTMLVYTGLESSAILEDMDLIHVVQALITKCMDSDELCNEFYLQIIKQTTETYSDTSFKAALRYWHLMIMCTCVMLPPNELVLHYLHLHLKRFAIQKNEEGKSAQFSIKSLHRTYENKGRKFPPSYIEIKFVTKREPIEYQVHLTNGQVIWIELDSATSAEELMLQIKAKTGMRLDAEGFGLFEKCGGADQYILPSEKIADSMYKWEKWAQTKKTTTKDLKYTFKKRLFIVPFVNLNDPVEVELVYHQLITEVFEEKIPLTKEDAVKLCALRAQTEYGDYGNANNFDYNSVMRILPRHLRDLIKLSEISEIHKTLVGMSPRVSDIAQLDVLKLWPLFGATIYEVSQSNTESLPKDIWLAVTKLGIHLMEIKGQSVFSTIPFCEVVECSPSIKTLTLQLGNSNNGLKLTFNTTEAQDIFQLVTDYRDALLTKDKSSTGDLSMAEQFRVLEQLDVKSEKRSQSSAVGILC